MLNNNLRAVREEMGISVSTLAKRAKTTRQTITKIELHGQEPSGLLVLTISEACNKDPREIFFIDAVKHVEQNSSA